MRPTTIDLSVRVSDGSFETSLSFPVGASQFQVDGLFRAWMKALADAVALCKIEDNPNEQGQGT